MKKKLSHPLHKIGLKKFLKDYWQKKPLLIKNAFPQFSLNFTADELAGLSLEEDVHSRLVQYHRGKWLLEQGPFAEDRFQRLPPSHWTLLVQETDHIIPEIHQLKENFRFIPDWRFDDVMISYASDQGSVGPHVDQYDVFLLQGRGRRRWMIETSPRSHHQDEFIPNIDLKILTSFQPDEEYIVEPGDLLYLPPRFAHHGVSLGECMTLSFGFRAPSMTEMMVTHLEQFLEESDESFRYTDPQLQLQPHPAEITSHAIKNLQQQLHQAWLQTLKKENLHSWLGELMTTPKRKNLNLNLNLNKLKALLITQDLPKPKEKTLKKLSASSPFQLQMSYDQRLAFSELKNEKKIFLFINGQKWVVPYNKKWSDFIKMITDHHHQALTSDQLKKYLGDLMMVSFLAMLVETKVFLWKKI